MTNAISQQIAQELAVKPHQIQAAIQLLDDGATVPFIARYRKEATQGLDDTQLRQLTQRLTYLRELDARRQVIITNIEQQGKLTPALQHQLLTADNKTRLEDLYLPFKAKRKTKAQIAIAAGIEPLALALLKNPQLVPEHQAQDYINTQAGFADVEQVLEGAQQIIIEHIGEQADLLDQLRRYIWQRGHIESEVVKDKKSQAAKYKDYFAFSEALKKVPSHRALALFRGKNEGFLKLKINVDPHDDNTSVCSAEAKILQFLQLNLTTQAAASWLTQTIHKAWQNKLKPSIENNLFSQLKAQAEQEAINVFAKNLEQLLLAAPAGEKVTLGIDPGLRTGCKFVVVDGQGKLLHYATIFPHEPQNNWDKSVRTLVNVIRQYKVALIAIGNGTASRETDKLVAEALTQLKSQQPDINIQKVLVSEAGASVYSASELAANEFPELDVSIRGAVSIARRLQDPLAELVKIDPKAIGVGQYQHDVNQSQLAQSLIDVTEDCVNRVGVELNTASAALLQHVAGLNKTIANNIVKYREQHGAFRSRQQLLNVARLGEKVFEQAAGFLRIRNGENPLDNSAVHPESYPLVEQISKQLQTPIHALINQGDILAKLDKTQLLQQGVNEITLTDVLAELEKPGRDPRPAFKTVQFNPNVQSINDLTVGMILEGVVSNVANFGAFVDVGVHQDGLVHISQLTDKFVSDPSSLVKAGDIVKVKVIEVDTDRKRIAFTMRLNQAVSNQPKSTHHAPKNKAQPVKRQHKNKPSKAPANAAMGDAFAQAFAKLKK